MRERVQQLEKFDVIRFAQKANSNIHVLSIFREMGVLVDAVSLGEIERALRAGYTPGTLDQEIVITADIIDESTLIRVIELGNTSELWFFRYVNATWSNRQQSSGLVKTQFWFWTWAQS